MQERKGKNNRRQFAALVVSTALSQRPLRLCGGHAFASSSPTIPLQVHYSVNSYVALRGLFVDGFCASAYVQFVPSRRILCD
jgi:hypothetical protein